MKSSWTKNEDHLRVGLELGCVCECDLNQCMRLEPIE